MTSLPGLNYWRRRRSRWGAFTDAELAELLISLERRRSEAEPGFMGGPGNAYVRTELVAALIEEIECHCVTGR